MARSRLLKPGFFKNEDLAQLEPHARLCFAGLWLLADREGRLEDRPLRIKADIFPYELLDINTLLNILVSAGFITRYRVNAQPYIAVLKFAQHQSPHVKETASTIPAPDLSESSTVLAPVEPSLEPLVLVTRSLNPSFDPDPVLATRSAQKNTAREASPKANGNGRHKPADTRSKRPIFTGQRLTVFEWFLAKAEQTLGEKNYMDFDIHEWFFVLDAQVAKTNIVIPPRDNGAWLEQQLVQEAARRGLDIAVINSASDKTSGNADALRRMVARHTS